MTLRLLGFFPHPDDEAYAAGGTLAAAARAGVAVTVAVATRGEAGVELDAASRAPGRALGDRRLAELAAACAAIGAGPPRCLGLPDGAVARHDPDDAVARLAALLDEVQPDAVLTLGRDGVYGHADHLACTALLDAAVARRGLRPRVLHAAFPRDLFAPVRARLARLRPSPLSPHGRELPLGTPRREVDLVVPLDEAARAAKLAALAAHRSQLPGGDPRRFLRRGLVDALLREEWWVHVSGPALPAAATSPLDGLA